MATTAQQVQMGVTNYIEQEIAKKATGIRKFSVYFVLPQLNLKIPKLIQQYQQNEMFKDFFDETGNIQLDAVYNTAKSAIQKSGQVEYAGIIFNETDIDKLYTYIKNIAQGE